MTKAGRGYGVGARYYGASADASPNAAGITVSFGYDLVDNRTSVTDGLSQTTHFGYDGLKRNTATTDPANSKEKGSGLEF